MSSKHLVAISAAVALAIKITAAGASHPAGTDQLAPPVVDVPRSTGATSATDNDRIVDGYLEYIGALRDRSDVSLKRMQSAVGNRLRQGKYDIGYISPAYPENDWITLEFFDGGAAMCRAAILHFGNDRDPNGTLPFCRLSLDRLRERLLAAGYTEGRDIGELGEIVVWLFSKDDVWIEVSTRWANTSGSERMCAWIIQARGKTEPRSGSK